MGNLVPLTPILIIPLPKGSLSSTTASLKITPSSKINFSAENAAAAGDQFAFIVELSTGVESNSRNDLAAHVYDITYGSLVPGVDSLVIRCV